ncbi:MAG TPA: hypothetical protein VL326_15100 [Kofleriaceae bacterium]|jgi:hypothetical protein|nr:hypothetical protein [Kofleriaceae bacterium]
MRRAVFMLALAACGTDHRTDDTDDVIAGDDPLNVSMSPAPGSLDDLHERIIAQRCSGQPGLCHNGQFEPNLSTPAVTYAYLVNRPGIEKSDRLRVKPGSAASSLFIDKIRNRNGVATQMPLGAEPLEESEIKELEAWIDAGALREPGAAQAPALNNPPKRPQIGIFNASGTRLDGTGPLTVAPNTTLTLRHTVSDFETPDASIPFAAFVLNTADGHQVVLEPTASDPQTGPTTYDAAGPMAQGDVFDYKRTWAIGTTIDIRDQTTGTITTVPASGQDINVIAVYVDKLPAQGGIVAFDFSATPIHIQ